MSMEVVLILTYLGAIAAGAVLAGLWYWLFEKGKTSKEDDG